MTVVARFSLPAEAFPFGEVTTVREGIRVRLDSLVPTGDALFPYFWVPTDVVPVVEQTLDEADSIKQIKTVDDTGDETLFRVEWVPDVNGVVEAISDVDGVLLEAWGVDDTWTLRVRFDDRKAVSAFYRACVAAGVTPTLDELHQRSTATGWSDLGLTDPQREALLAALDAGYYEVPREITLRELADRFDISDTALSQRLRRGLTTVLSATL